MSATASLQNLAASSKALSHSTHAGLLLQRKCACGSPTSSLTGECAECKSKKRLQTKLSIGASNDPLELEADRVADQIVAGPANPTVRRAPPRIQRFSGQSNDKVSTVPASVDQALASHGRPLESALRQDMEQRFGHDFSLVRVHSGAAAEQSAQDVNAHAYTVGHGMIFGSGQFAPGTHQGQRLIAHELTHVVQQNSAPLQLQREPAGKPTTLPKPPPGGNVLYIGMNNFKLELAALDTLYKGKPVVVTRVTLATDTANTVSGDKSFDLTNDAGVDVFVGSLGLDKGHSSSVAGLLKRESLMENRDDMAHVMVVYAMTESDGQDRMSRVVLSGHSFGLDIMDTPLKNHIQFSYLVDLAGVFPKAAAQTKHVYVSACYAGAEDNIREYFRKAFPNLITFSGFTDQCPTDKHGAEILAEWAKTTDADPTTLAKPPEGRSNWASGVYQGVESSSPADTMNSLRADEAQFKKYFDGVKVDADAHRGWLTTYYGQARTADLRPGSIKGTDHDYAHQHAEQAVRLRLWKEVVARFWQDNETKIRAGYGKVTVPNFGKMTRKEALKAIEKFPSAAQGTDADKTEAGRLLEGLRQLDEKVLPA